MPTTPQSLAARATTPFAWLDRPLNALNDGSLRLAPWLAWPLSRPRPDEPLPGRLHALLLVHNVLLHVGFEAAMRRAGGSSGRDLAKERRVSVAVGAPLYLLATGAWDRRAARLRSAPGAVSSRV